MKLNIKDINQTTKEISEIYKKEFNIPVIITYPFWFIMLFLIFCYKKLKAGLKNENI